MQWPVSLLLRLVISVLLLEGPVEHSNLLVAK